MAGFAYFGKMRVLGQETVAGMYRFYVGYFSCAYNCGDIQVTFAAGRLSYADSFIGKADMERIAVDLGIDSDSADAQFPACADDAKRYLSTIGDQDLRKH
jgi:hypothetical protein